MVLPIRVEDLLADLATTTPSGTDKIMVLLLLGSTRPELLLSSRRVIFVNVNMVESTVLVLLMVILIRATPILLDVIINIDVVVPVHRVGVPHLGDLEVLIGQDDVGFRGHLATVVLALQGALRTRGAPHCSHLRAVTEAL
ncbi:hypothetical protein FOZ60_016180 [Perkinsus olseni]|uniref:Uncharacterized protein n=1 Tax=Perkinsus olseni TaxID=32597 RepID=A0A7J6N4Q9_PEROL|nr:hypothetical protein FOZ60_016180 [Perkinsus olseni]